MIIVKNNDIDLGTIDFGKPYFFSFKINNGYPEVLYIDTLLSGCASCTEATIDRSTLFPGEDAEIKVIFTPGSLGYQKKKITIINHTLKKKEQNVVLSFKATVH